MNLHLTFTRQTHILTLILTLRKSSQPIVSIYMCVCVCASVCMCACVSFLFGLGEGREAELAVLEDVQTGLCTDS